MLTSFNQVIKFLIEKGILNDFKNRIVAIKDQTLAQNWANHSDFNAIIERFEY
ncbi:DUF6155 family protein [Flavobacterium psychrophilum]|nr:DUF6155 family protein [Flavobacterium psychrophilum]